MKILIFKPSGHGVMTNKEDFKLIEDVFLKAVAMESSIRTRFLDDVCAGKPELRRYVNELLIAAEETEDFLEKPVLDKQSRIQTEEQLESEERETANIVGRCLGNHEILSLIAVGGMGHVYKARHRELGRLEVLKILPTRVGSDPVQLRRFQREAKAAASLKHPGIVLVHDIGEVEGIHFIAMEFVEGEDLAARLKNGPLPVDEVVETAIKIASILLAAHRKGIIHRDIKPSNIMRMPDGEIKILDFGLMKTIKDKNYLGPENLSMDSLTQTGTIVGTPNYLSPEQILNRNVDQRSDIFSLGVVIYQLATGELPFEGTSILDTLDRICHKDSLPIARFSLEASERLEAVVRKCMQKAPGDRYRNVKELIRDLEATQLSTVPILDRIPTWLWPLISVLLLVILVASLLL